MAHITIQDAQVYVDKTKLNVLALDGDLEASVATEVLANLSASYDTSVWVDNTNTPKLVKKILAMAYVGYFYQRTYSEENLPTDYGNILLADAARLIDGINGGSLTLVDAVAPSNNPSQPDFYPNDNSSLMKPTEWDKSLGGPFFSMQKVF